MVGKITPLTSGYCSHRRPNCISLAKGCCVIVTLRIIWHRILLGIWHNLPSPSNDARHSQIMLLAEREDTCV